MKHSILIFFYILMLTLSAFAQNDSPVKVEKVGEYKWRALQITGSEDAQYSPSGKWLTINTDSRFYLLPTAKLDGSINNLEKAPSVEGQVVGFMPSGKILYTTMRGIFTLDPANLQRRTFFREVIENERFYSQNAMVVVSENLIVSGDGQFDMGLEKGNILLFDLRARQRPKRGLRIDGFEYPSLSPSGRFVLYEHSGENSNHAALYDVRQNVNHQISRRFNFKTVFPKYKRTLEIPIAWVGADKFLMIVEENTLGENDLYREEEIDGKEWLVLCDAATGKIIWKRQAEIAFLPSQFQQISPTKGVAQIGNRLYEISLLDGKANGIYGIHGTGFAVSPNKKSLAYFDDDMVLTSTIEGNGSKISFFLPRDWEQQQTAYKGRGTRPPLWSPDGKRIIVFGKNRLLFVRV